MIWGGLESKTQQFLGSMETKTGEAQGYWGGKGFLTHHYLGKVKNWGNRVECKKYVLGPCEVKREEFWSFPGERAKKKKTHRWG